MNKIPKELIIFTHGRLSEELVAVAKLIYGKIDSDLLTPISNEGLSLKSALAELREKTNNQKDYIIFTDFPGGSCFMAAKKLSSLNENIHTISGVNISMVLSFITKQDQFSIEELIRVIKTDGNRSIY